ncbi:hypothetical protein PybrP1_004216 [[Pythium] brassicae (nom. inval.)]|nr:hypothetical protein PybrP1_004216 [[Pythium] brassicae (nom. inval.)]
MLTLQLGQCGNQLGAALFQKLADETPTGDGGASESTFFRVSGHPSDCSLVDESAAALTARAVLVDMEPKVVQQCVRGRRGARWRYDGANTFMQQSGSGNNWAFGYAAHGAQHEAALLDLVQALTLAAPSAQELERCDLHRGFFTLQSVAGGTGSGLGSFLTELLADHFPSARLLNAVVWPYASGEVIVQNYNTVLTMARLAAAAHGVFVLQNDAASAMCQQLLRIARPSFREINDVLATHLASALLPVASCEPVREICQELCQHPGYKLLDIKTIPQMPHRSKEFSTHTWTGILKHLHQMQVANAPLEEGIDWDVSLATAEGRARNTAVASVLLLRGKDASAADVAAFRQPQMYAQWNPRPFCWHASTTPFNAYEKTATLVSNSKAAVLTLASTADKAFQMFAHGAYLHQYRRYGVDEAFFQQAFLEIDQVVQNYKALR